MSYDRRVLSSGVFVYLLPLLLFLTIAECRPLFGLLDLFGASEIANGTSLISALFQAHLQHTLEKFLALADVAQVVLNNTSRHKNWAPSCLEIVRRFGGDLKL